MSAYSELISDGVQPAGSGAYSAAGTFFVSFPVSPSCSPLAIPPLSEQCKHTAPEECWTLWPHSKRSSAVHSVQPGRAVLRESAHAHTHIHCQISSCSHCCCCHCAHELQCYFAACSGANSTILCPLRMLSSLTVSPIGAVGLNEFQSPFPPLVGYTARPCGAIGHRRGSKF